MRPPAVARSVHGLLVALVLGLVAATLCVAPGAGASDYTATTYAARLLNLVNHARDAHGLKPLTVATGTTAVASDWTAHLADAGELSHNPGLAHDLAAHGSSDWTVYGENVGVGSVTTPDDLFQAYMDSPEHRDNILTADYRYVGVAVQFSGARAWNTFDFVDMYATGSTATHTKKTTSTSTSTETAHHESGVRHVHHVAAVAVQQVQLNVPVRPQPTTPHHRARTHHRTAHVEALHATARPRAAIARMTQPASFAAPLMAAVTPLPRPLPSGRTLPVAVAIAVLMLAVTARRWILVVAR